MNINTIKRTIAFLELLMVFPATLFMVALFLRNVQPPQFEPAHSAGRFVDWYAARPALCLDLFLVALPFAAFVIGCATVIRSWRSDEALRQSTTEAMAALRAHLAAIIIAVATLLAAGILAVVALHVITD